MVENTQNTNSNDDGTARKRRGLFGSRRRATSAVVTPEAAPQVASPETEPAPGAQAPAAPAAERQPAREQQAPEQ